MTKGRTSISWESERSAHWRCNRLNPIEPEGISPDLLIEKMKLPAPVFISTYLLKRSEK